MNRNSRRDRKARPTIVEQRTANLMMNIHSSGDLPQADGESESAYFARIRECAQRKQHEQRKRKRNAARAARKANR